MDPTRVDSSILSETMRSLSLRPSHLPRLLSTRSLLLMRQTIQPTTYNSSYGRLLRNLLAIAVSSLPATTRTRSSNLSIPDVQSLILESKESRKPKLLEPSSTVSGLYLRQKAFSMIQRLRQKLSKNIFPIFGEC